MKVICKNMKDLTNNNRMRKALLRNIHTHVQAVNSTS